MRLYICIDGSFAGTQEDAKRVGKGFSLTEVPTDKAGLIDYLNGMVNEARGQPAAVFERQAAPVAPQQVRQSQDSFTASEIAGFILDRATTAQVESIFATLGTRFAELRK